MSCGHLVRQSDLIRSDLMRMVQLLVETLKPGALVGAPPAAHSPHLGRDPWADAMLFSRCYV